jgi:urate oxidase
MIVLGPNQYGKAEVRLLRVSRTGPVHELRDLCVSVTLSGALGATHLTGDNSAVLSTDAQKNTVFAFAAEHGVGAIEDFALLLARHFVTTQDAIGLARVTIDQYAWEPVGGTGHSFARSGREVRTTSVTHDGERSWVVSGLRDLVVLNTAGSEFWGFARDRYTTLAETTDRILATAVDARWRYASPPDEEGTGQEGTDEEGTDEEGTGWDAAYGSARDLLLAAFAQTYSYSLQQTLYAMGKRVLEGVPQIAEIRLALPNKHHFEVDMSPFGLPSKGEVFYASDRPYGLIEGTVSRDDAPPPGPPEQRQAW